MHSNRGLYCLLSTCHGNSCDADSGDNDDHVIDENGDDDADATDIACWG